MKYRFLNMIINGHQRGYRISSIGALVLVFISYTSSFSQNIFISPNGSDGAEGSHTKPLRTLEQAFEQVSPGDTVFLLPGTYEGVNKISNKHGAPNKPIVITAYDTQNIPIIDGLSEPDNAAFNPGISLDSCSWINISAIKFENCWNSVIDLRQSNYISIQYCHLTSGKWVIHPHGTASHHILVENSVLHHPPQVWKGWSWLEIHHGVVECYNGAILHPRKSGGGHIVRNNEIKNVFNAFRTRPADIREDGNTEIYDNYLENIRDNEFEPESWAWNMHYYNNDHVNVHKLFSIDGVEGGNIYIYGNTYTQDNDPWTNYQVSGIYKYKNGPLTYPCYVFNNSYYTTARVMKYGESSNHHMRHYNNAYQFFETKNAFRVVDWQPGYEFDYDCINQDWSENIKKHHQEQHGLSNTDPGFTDPIGGNFTLKHSSACVDAGKRMSFPEFNWKQTYEGPGPDIGAREAGKKVQGPPFRFIPSPEGSHYEEYPRISRHYVQGPHLLLYFSAPLEEQDFSDKLKVYRGEELIGWESSVLFDDGFCLLISFEESLDAGSIRLSVDNDVSGVNGLPLVTWGSTLRTEKKESTPSLDFPDPWDDSLPVIENVQIDHQVDNENKKLIVTTHISPPIEVVYKGILGFRTADDVYLDGAYAEHTPDGGIYTIDLANVESGKYRLTLLLAGQLFQKEILIK